MAGNESWITQGRQAHCRFGSGTAGGEAASDVPGWTGVFEGSGSWAGGHEGTEAQSLPAPIDNLNKGVMRAEYMLQIRSKEVPPTAPNTADATPQTYEVGGLVREAPVEVRLPNGEAIVDESSPTGTVIQPGPAAGLVRVAREGRFAGEMHIADSADADVTSGAILGLYASLGLNLGHGGTFDYQREGNSIIGFKQWPQYRNVSNVNVGLFCQQAGMSLDQVLRLAGIFAWLKSNNYKKSAPYGLAPETARFIVIGFEIGQTGAYGPPAGRHR